MRYLLSMNESFGPSVLNSLFRHAKSYPVNHKNIRYTLTDYENVSNSNFNKAPEDAVVIMTKKQGLKENRKGRNNPSPYRLLKLFICRDSSLVGELTTDGEKDVNRDKDRESGLDEAPEWLAQANYCVIIDLDMTTGTRDDSRYGTNLRRWKDTSQDKMVSSRVNMIRYMRELVRRHGPERLFPIVFGEKGSLVYLLSSKSGDVVKNMKGGNPITIDPLRLGIIRVGERLELALGMVNNNTIPGKVMANLKDADDVFRNCMKRLEDGHGDMIWKVLSVHRSSGLHQVLSAIEFQNEDYDVSLIKKKLKELTDVDVVDSEKFLSVVKKICGVV